MSSTPFAGPLRLEPQVSRSLTRFLFFLHALALVAAWTAPLAWPVKLVLTAAVLIGGWRELRRQRGVRDATLLRIVWGADGTWSVRVNGRWQSARLEPDVHEHPLLVVLPLRTEDGRVRRIVIAPDAIDADSYRRLRVRIRQSG
ncbi:MAG TPA: protein YgfX [Gammaproteobacteria bacterium]|nr:protein YgfX [Gammaproteobacteria bacterium]